MEAHVSGASFASFSSSGVGDSCIVPFGLTTASSVCALSVCALPNKSNKYLLGALLVDITEHVLALFLCSYRPLRVVSRSGNQAVATIARLRPLCARVLVRCSALSSKPLLQFIPSSSCDVRTGSGASCIVRYTDTTPSSLFKNAVCTASCVVRVHDDRQFATGRRSNAAGRQQLRRVANEHQEGSPSRWPAGMVLKYPWSEKS